MGSRPILVVGGCGLLGYHFVEALIKDPGAGPITVVSRNPKHNIFDGVTYLAGDVADSTFIDAVFAQVRPAIVFHVAAPRPLTDPGDAAWEDTNVVGTHNLVDAATRTPETKVFLFTSTVNVITGHEHVYVTEDARPYWQPGDKAIPYWRSKAAAEKIVLAANSGALRTVSLRPCMVIGLQEHALIPAQLEALAKGKTNIQLGDNKNLFDIVSADNCTDAHLLAMHALLDPSKANGRVDGEAFNITDGNALPFWDVQRIIWRTAGDETQMKDVTVIPTWVAKAMAAAGGLVYYVLFFGSKNPELNSHVVNFCTSNYTYNIDKARRVLGYNPVPHTEDVIRAATKWELDHRAQAAGTE